MNPFQSGTPSSSLSPQNFQNSTQSGTFQDTTNSSDLQNSNSELLIESPNTQLRVVGPPPSSVQGVNTEMLQQTQQTSGLSMWLPVVIIIASAFFAVYFMRKYFTLNTSTDEV